MRFVTGAALALLTMSASAFAQTAVSQKIGVIDMQSALLATKDGQKAVADLRAKFGPKDQDLQKRQGDLQAKQEQLRKTQNTMSDEAKAKLSADIDALGRAFERDSQDLKDDIDQEQQRMTQELGGKIMQVLTKYASDNHFNLVFDVSGQPSNVLFASSTIDVTRDVIAAYDKANGGPAVTTAAPAAAAPMAGPPAAPAPAAPKAAAGR